MLFGVLEANRCFVFIAWKGIVVLDGVLSAAASSLQRVGYVLVEVAFSLGTDALSDYKYVVRLARLCGNILTARSGHPLFEVSLVIICAWCPSYLQFDT